MVLMNLGPRTYNPGIPLMDIAFFASLFSVTVNAFIPVIRKITMVNKKLIQTSFSNFGDFFIISGAKRTGRPILA